MPSTAVPSSVTEKIDHATDAFIGARLPQWLLRATPAQINTLRDSFSKHRDSEQKLWAATLELLPLQRFAEQQIDALLADHLPAGQALSDLQWLEITPEFGRYMGSGWPYVVPRYTRKPGLLTLMQNFHDGASFHDGSGLVLPGTLELAYKDTAALVKACRAGDVGARYQTLLKRTFNPSTLALLSENKRAGLRLATEVALLKGQIDAHDQVALKALADDRETPTQGLFAYPGSLRMLGQPVADAMVMQMRGPEGEDAGVILYLASDPNQALRKYASWALMTEQFTALLRQPDYLAYVSQLIALGERPAFVQKLRTRLKDPSPDLELDGKTHADDVFAKLVALQVNQAKEDARLLLVPTADADSKAARAWMPGRVSV